MSGAGEYLEARGSHGVTPTSQATTSVTNSNSIQISATVIGREPSFNYPISESMQNREFNQIMGENGFKDSSSSQ